MTAGLVGLSEQIVSFPPRQRLTLSGKAWQVVGIRFLVDAGFAVLVAFLAEATMGAQLDRWWQGLSVALFSSLGVRSPGFEAGEQALGLQGPYSRLRDWAAEKAKNLAKVASSADRQQTREDLTRLETPVYWVAERVRAHLAELDELEDRERQRQQARIEEQDDDLATEDHLRLSVLLNIAHELGGDELVRSIIERAQNKPWQDEPPATAPA